MNRKKIPLFFFEIICMCNLINLGDVLIAKTTYRNFLIKKQHCENVATLHQCQWYLRLWKR